MFDSANISKSSQHFLEDTGHTIMDLFNQIIVDKADLLQLVKENDVDNISEELPGLIIQSYLVLVRLFNLDPMEPIAFKQEDNTHESHHQQLAVITEVVKVEPSGEEEHDKFDTVTVTYSDNSDKKRVFESLRRQRKSMSIPCDMCQKIVTKGYLATHMKITHGEGWAGRTQYEPTECDKCEKTFGSKQSLRQHLNRHTAERETCEICGKDLANRMNLKRHMLTHLEQKPFQCDFCEYQSIEKKNYEAHVMSHTGEKPFVCELCDFRCTRSQNLRSHHVAIHTNERPHGCETCEATFKSKKGLRKHERTHSTEKPHKCQMCDYRAAERYNVTAHQKQVHLGIKRIAKKFNDKQDGQDDDQGSAQLAVTN